MFGRLWTKYNAALETNPLLIKAMTSLTGFTLGDILAQKFVMPDEKGYDVMRTARLGSFGFLVHGPTGHYFYSWLDKQIPGTAMKTVATKVAIDQLLWNPCFGVMFFSYLGLAEGKSFTDIQAKIKNDLTTAVVGSWTVWIPAHFVNFRFVPSSQRLLYINSIQIGYNIFLSFLGNKKVDAPEVVKEAEGAVTSAVDKAK
ncbi:peroxisomal membrane protein [Nannochloropsis oceanica]